MTEQFIETVHTVQNNMEIDGICYRKLDGEEYYLQEIFDSEELLANLDKNAIAVKDSVYDYIVYDSSTVERPFAVALDNDPDVRMFSRYPTDSRLRHQLEHILPIGRSIWTKTACRSCISCWKPKVRCDWRV